MIERRASCPPTSSVGRLFDAVAAISGVRSRVSYEGQAAMELEWLAAEPTGDNPYPFEVSGGPAGDDFPMIIDTRPLIRAAAEDAQDGVPRQRIARRFHNTLANLIVQICERIRQWIHLNTVALSWGVFMNALLIEQTLERLNAASFEVLRHCLVPPNDGGICLGQLAIAAASLASANSKTLT